MKKTVISALLLATFFTGFSLVTKTTSFKKVAEDGSRSLAQAVSSGTLIEAVHIQQIGTPVSGPVFVSSGLLLPKGKLQASDVPNISVKMNGGEVQSYTYALQGRYSDGTLRSVLIQFTVPQTNVNDAIRIELGGRSTAQLSRVEPNGEPSAILLPDNVDSLINSSLFGPTVKRSSAPSSPAYFTKYESDFDKYEIQHWNVGGGTGGQSYSQNFYDRVLAQFAFWARTRNPIYFEHAANLSRRYGVWNASNNYGIAEWQANLEGQALHYWLTGDEKSRDVVIRCMQNLDMYRGGPRLSKWDTDANLDNRVQKAVIGTKVIAIELGATSVPAGFGMVAIPDIRAKAATDLNLILSSQQVDGSYIFSNECNASKNYMSGMLNDVLGQYYDEVTPDSRIIPSLSKSYDYLMTTQWRPSTKMFQYLSLSCRPGTGSGGDTTPTADLNGLFLNGLGFLYQKTGNSKWLQYGEDVFQGGVNGAYVGGEKQFNQWYQDSWRWLGYRAGVTFGGSSPITPPPVVVPPTPTLTLSASNTSITLGQSVTLTWSTTNATSCTASGGWSGSAALSGSQSVTPTQTTTYTLICGSASQAVTITVSVPPSTPPVTTPPPPVVITPPTTPPPTTPNVGNGMNDTFPPSIPDRLTAFTSHAGELTVRWDPSFDRGGIGGYKVYRDSAQVSDTPKEEYIDKGLTPNQSYTYSVSAYDRSGNSSSQSSSRTFKVDGSITTPTVVTPTQTSTPTFSFTKNLRYGQENSDVLALQTKLKSLGYFSASVTPNGYFGRQTLTAVIKYQRAMGLSTTGFVGPMTRGRLSAN